MTGVLLRFQELGEPSIVAFADAEVESSMCLLDVPIEELRFCPHCQHESVFLFNRECQLGLIGTCVDCWHPLFRPFTRTISGVCA